MILSQYGVNSTRTGLAKLPKNLTKHVRELAIDGKAFKDGIWVDFLTDKQDVYINEVNSLPGFTGISMFPWLWQQDGLSSSQLIDNLIKG